MGACRGLPPRRHHHRVRGAGELRGTREGVCWRWTAIRAAEGGIIARDECGAGKAGYTGE